MALDCEAFLNLILHLFAHLDLKRFVQKIGFHEARTGVCVIVKQRDQYPLFSYKNYACSFMSTPTCVLILTITITTEVRFSVPVLIIDQ
jgi:hypothetical protein